VAYRLAPDCEDDVFPTKTEDLAWSKTCVEANHGEIPKGLGCVLDVLLFFGVSQNSFDLLPRSAQPNLRNVVDYAPIYGHVQYSTNRSGCET
jgi:hypothetical protein